MILELRSAVEAHLGRKISGAVVAIPRLPALYGEDLKDAFEFSGLVLISSYPYWLDLGGFSSETTAVSIANGFGLRSNYTDFEACKYEGSNFPPGPTPSSVLSISYTKEMLTSAWVFLRSGLSPSVYE
jgi:hypothetical protein